MFAATCGTPLIAHRTREEKFAVSYEASFTSGMSLSLSLDIDSYSLGNFTVEEVMLSLNPPCTKNGSPSLITLDANPTDPSNALLVLGSHTIASLAIPLNTSTIFASI